MLAGVAGVKSCEAALAYPDLRPEFTLRRANILVYKALHELEANMPEAALNTLTQAEAIQKQANSIAFNHSIGLNILLSRAFALRALGKTQEAFELFKQAYAARPYNKQMNAAFFAFAPDAELRIESRSLFENAARTNPKLTEFLFLRALVDHDFKQMAILYNQMPPPRATDSHTFDRLEEKTNQSRNHAAFMTMSAARAGQYAYALEALGRHNEALAALDAIAQKIKSMTPAPKPLPPEGEKESKGDQAERQRVNLEILAASVANNILKNWYNSIELRSSIATAQGTDLEKTRASILSNKSYLARDLLQLLSARMPKDKDVSAALAKEEQNYAKMQISLKMQALNNSIPLKNALLHAESDQLGFSLSYKNADMSDLDLQKVMSVGTPDEDSTRSDTQIITFHSEQIPPTSVEEITLLSAAIQARKMGKKGLIIADRTDYINLYKCFNHIS
jgi:hypothetical protein